jgi:hypothetical protein
MEQKSRSPSQRRNEWGRREKGLERRRRQGKKGNFEEGSSHVSDGVGNRIKNVHFNARRKRSVGAAGEKSVDKFDEGGMNVTRTLYS